MTTFGPRSKQAAGLRLLLILRLSAMTVPSLRAQRNAEFDDYKVRIGGFWLLAYPGGSITDATSGDIIDLQKDFGFGSYSSFAGKFDWKFTHKNHFYVTGANFSHSRVATLKRTFVFQGHTFDVGVVTKADISAPLIAPGYQYDIIRRRRGNFGLAVQIDVFNSSASFFAAAQANNNNQAVSAKKFLLAPIPVAGPAFRYDLTNSPRLFVEAK
ncbi:MAG TPA: hypothetical protein VMT53_05930 [Terriglobales bacterium]|nr:hypothetical protein [Terriglobales bacterium]